MTPSLRQAWTAIIQPADYEAHMAANGQAQANADLVRDLLLIAPPSPGVPILFAGAGTGQMFDYIDAGILRPYRATFTDINPTYLERLSSRLESHGLAFETMVDDVEQSRVPGYFDLVIAVLVLEHVDWRDAVASLCGLATWRVFVVIQENPPQLESRPALGTMNILREIHSHPIDRDELVPTFEKHSFRVHSISSREAADSKKMVALEFVRDRPPVVTPPR
jgi:hypothetical protein